MTEASPYSPQAGLELTLQPRVQVGLELEKPPYSVNADIEGEECHYNYLDSETSNGEWRCGGAGGEEPQPLREVFQVQALQEGRFSGQLSVSKP